VGMAEMLYIWRIAFNCFVIWFVPVNDQEGNIEFVVA
jgi:hypothetical protein